MPLANIESLLRFVCFEAQNTVCLSAVWSSKIWFKILIISSEEKSTKIFRRQGWGRVGSQWHFRVKIAIELSTLTSKIDPCSKIPENLLSKEGGDGVHLYTNLRFFDGWILKNLGFFPWKCSFRSFFWINHYFTIFVSSRLGIEPIRPDPPPNALLFIRRDAAPAPADGRYECRNDVWPLRLRGWL